MATIMLGSYEPAKGWGKECFTYRDGAFNIHLFQKGKDRFAVQYGKQLDVDLSYSEACRKLGGAFMHSLACEGAFDA